MTNIMIVGKDPLLAKELRRQIERILTEAELADDTITSIVSNEPGVYDEIILFYGYPSMRDMDEARLYAIDIMKKTGVLVNIVESDCRTVGKKEEQGQPIKFLAVYATAEHMDGVIERLSGMIETTACDTTFSVEKHIIDMKALGKRNLFSSYIAITGVEPDRLVKILDAFDHSFAFLEDKIFLRKIAGFINAKKMAEMA